MQTSSIVQVKADALRCFCGEVLRKVGVGSQDAEMVADCLIEADLRGIAGHGSARLLLYVRRIKEGGCNPRPDIRVVQEAPAAVLLDGDGG